MATILPSDILDTMIAGGYVPSSIVDSPNRYIDHERRVCCALGALAIRADIEPSRVPSLWHRQTFLVDPKDLCRRLMEHYQVSREFLWGIEAGFEDWDMALSLKSVGDYVSGYHVGQTALNHFLHPPFERGELVTS